MSRSFAITYTSPWCERRPLWPTTPFPRNFKHHNMTITPMGTYNVLIFMWYTVFSLIFEACKQHQCIFLEFTVLYCGEITKIAKCTERCAIFEYVGISTSSCGSPRALIGYKPPFDGNELCADRHWGIKRRQFAPFSVGQRQKHSKNHAIQPHAFTFKTRIWQHGLVCCRRQVAFWFAFGSVTEEAIAFTTTVARADKDFGGEVHQYGHTWTTTDDDLFPVVGNREESAVSRCRRESFGVPPNNL